MVKQQEKSFSSNSNGFSFTNSFKSNQKQEPPIHIPVLDIKNNTPFIPRALKNQINDNNKKNDNFMHNINLEETKLITDDLNKIIIPMGDPHINNRKNSAGAESYSTCDEMSPEKLQNSNKKKTFPKKNKKKKGNKSPFKGEAKDFKIKYKTELCKYYECNGYCKYGDKCAYAHGKENLRSKVTNTTAYRTKKCTQFFEQGYCPYGNRCQFAHQLKSNIINNPYDKGMSYTKILETISKLENVGNIKKLVEKPRLKIFEEICKEEEGNESRLLNDIKKLKQTGLYKMITNAN